MALTSAQMAAVRSYAGYERGVELNPYLESKLLALTADEEALVVAVLAQLAALVARADLVATNGTLEAIAIKETKLREGDPLALYAAQGRRLVSRLVVVLGVEVGRDYFAAGGGAGLGGAFGIG